MSNKLRRICSTLICTVVLACGCSGGGSSGTGGQRYEGAVLSRTGAAVANASVTVLETGAVDVTDTNGNFVIDSERVTGDVSLGVDTDGTSFTVSIAGVPEDADTIRLQIEIDEDSGTGSANDVRFERDDNNSSDDDHSGDHSGSGGGDSSSSSSSSGGDDHGGSENSGSGHDGSSSGNDDHGESSSGTHSSSSGHDDGESSSSGSSSSSSGEDDGGHGGHGGSGHDGNESSSSSGNDN